MRVIGRLWIVGLLSLLPATALADDESSHLLTPWGMSASVGGGVIGFLDTDSRDVVSTGGSWEARVAAGTREWVGMEAAYIGSAQGIDALGLDSSAVLLGSGFEAAARVNLMKGAIQPYLLAGAGWTRYDITNSDVNTSDVSDSDDVFEIPLGIGLGYRYQRVILDARAVLRPVFDNDLFASDTGTDRRLDNLSGMVRAGFEF